MSLKNEIRRLQGDLKTDLWQRLLQSTEAQPQVKVTRHWYGDEYPGLGRHLKYSFWGEMNNPADEVCQMRGVLPFSYQLTAIPNGIGYRLCEGNYDSNLRQFSYALTLNSAERKVQHRARKVLGILERQAGVTRVSSSEAIGFVRL